MAKKAKRLINAVDWVKRATKAQMDRMREVLAELPGASLDPQEVAAKAVAAAAQVQEQVDAERNQQIETAILCDIPRAYALVPVDKVQGGIMAFHLLKFEVKDGVVVALEKSVENMRGVHLQEIENDILRDA